MQYSHQPNSPLLLYQKSEVFTNLRGDERFFFEVLSNDDIWKEFKKWMNVDSKHYYNICNYYEFKDGDSAVEHDYAGLILERHNLFMTTGYQNLVFTSSAMDNAACCNNFVLLRWLHNNRTEGCTTSSMDYAAYNRNLEMLIFLHENRTEGCTTNAMDIAAGIGSLEVVQWLHNNKTEGCTTAAMDNAAKNGHLQVVKWLHNNRMEGCTTAAMDNAFDRLDIMQFLYNKVKASCTIAAVNNAAECGNLEVVRFLFDKGLVKGNLIEAIDSAASRGHIKVVEYLYDKGARCTTNGFDSAAAHGHLEVVKWLNRRYAYCTHLAMDYAMINGYFDNVKYLYLNRQEGYTEKGIAKAIEYKRFSILRWLHDNSKDHDENIILDYAKRNNHLEVLEYLDN